MKKKTKLPLFMILLLNSNHMWVGGGCVTRFGHPSLVQYINNGWLAMKSGSPQDNNLASNLRASSVQKVTSKCQHGNTD